MLGVPCDVPSTFVQTTRREKIVLDTKQMHAANPPTTLEAWEMMPSRVNCLGCTQADKGSNVSDDTESFSL